MSLKFVIYQTKLETIYGTLEVQRQQLKRVMLLLCVCESRAIKRVLYYY